MRGKPVRVRFKTDTNRNIPAYAGKTSVVVPGQSGITEHPRVCGENAIVGCKDATTFGTSPRMRGKPGLEDRHILPRGNIPAYAGKTTIAVQLGNQHKEHPRVCGENFPFLYRIRLIRGTSPRMRGKLLNKLPIQIKHRNIPAYAGKTQHTPHGHQTVSEHPRVCGENLACRVRGFMCGGTSPRMRGKHILTCGSSFLKVILHSILFFCTVGGSMESPLQLPPF